MHCLHNKKNNSVPIFLRTKKSLWVKKIFLAITLKQTKSPYQNLGLHPVARCDSEWANLSQGLCFSYLSLR